jgi:cobalt-zinc-cadmium efflux system membrane fusion protein
MDRFSIPVAAAALLFLGAAACAAQDDKAGHMHGPDGRHSAVASTFGPSTGKSILSHHDLMILDTRKPGEHGGAVVEGCDVHSVVRKKGDPKAVIHREHNSYEPENGVYGSHMMYREPGEYEITKNVTLPDGTKHTLEFPIWVPDPHPKPKAGTLSPVLLGLGALAVAALVLAAFLLGRRSGRRAAADLTVLLLLAGLLPWSSAGAQEEAGHMHGPDGRHIAVASTFGSAPEPLRAYPSADLKEFAVQDRPPYRFRLSIENEELAPPDPDVVNLAPSSAKAIELQVVPATSRPLAGGLSTTGQVRRNPNGMVTVNSRVSGRLIRVNVTPGQTVPPGHVVAVIDSTEIAEAQAALVRAQSEQRQAEAGRGRSRAEVQRAASQVGEAEAALDRVRAQRAEAQAEVERARADVDVARAKAENSRKTLARQQQLASAGAFAQGPVETARSAMTAAEGELRAAETALSSQEAQVRRLEQGLRDGVVARKDLEAAQTAAAQARTRLLTAERQGEIARAALTREERIQRENLRDAREVQTAQADLDAAQLGVRSAEAAVARQQRAVDAAEALIAAQQRAIATARAQVASVRGEAREAEALAAGARQAVQSALNRLRLIGAVPGGGNQVRITAPIGGEIESRPVNAGQVVAAGEPLCTVLNARSLWIESDVFEKDLPRIRVGQQVAIAADAAPGRSFSGTINSIGSEVNPQTRAVRVRTVVLNPGGVLKPNMFVRVVIGSGSGNAVVIPAAALQEQGGEQVVFVKESEDAYRRKVVKVGPSLGEQVVIDSGIKSGDQVVTQGAYQLLSRVRK